MLDPHVVQRRRSSASAAICVSAVRAPVPMSAASIADDVSRRRLGARAGACAGAAVGRVGRRPRRRCRRASGRRGATPGAGRAASQPKRVGALAQAGDEVARLERVAALGIDARARCGSAARSGRCPRAIASSSIADSSANMPGHSPGRAHPRRRRHVERGQAVRRAAVRRRVHHPRRHRGLLGELARRSRSARRRRGAIAVSRPSRVGAEPHALDRRRPVADHGEHLLARERRA